MHPFQILQICFAWVQILEPQAAFQIGSRDIAICCGNRSDSICPSPGANHRFCNWQKTQTITDPPSCFTVTRLFHQHFTTYRPSCLTQRFQTLIYQSKGLYSIVLLSSLYAPWSTEALWHCFASSTVVSCQQFCHIGQLHRAYFSQWLLTYFFTALVQFCIDI